MDIRKNFFPVREVKGENKNAEARGDADGGTLIAPLMGDQTRSTDHVPHRLEPAVNTEISNSCLQVRVEMGVSRDQRLLQQSELMESWEGGKVGLMEIYGAPEAQLEGSYHHFQ